MDIIKELHRELQDSTVLKQYINIYVFGGSNKGGLQLTASIDMFELYTEKHLKKAINESFKDSPLIHGEFELVVRYGMFSVRDSKFKWDLDDMFEFTKRALHDYLEEWYDAQSRRIWR